jgi:hypothetical protein
MHFSIILIATGLLVATSSACRTKTNYTATVAVIMTRHISADAKPASQSELRVTYRPSVKVPARTEVPEINTVAGDPVVTRIMTEWADFP